MSVAWQSRLTNPKQVLAIGLLQVKQDQGNCERVRSKESTASNLKQCFFHLWLFWKKVFAFASFTLAALYRNLSHPYATRDSVSSNWFIGILRRFFGFARGGFRRFARFQRSV